MKRIAGLAAATAVTALAGGAFAGDFGQQVEQLLNSKSNSLFGINGTLDASSTSQVSGADAEADPTRLVTLAHGLTAHVVSKAPTLGGNVDQIALWPSDTNPTHLIFCNEEGVAAPGIQRVTIATGAVETIITGLNRCDPIRRTAWGTVFAAEENGSSSRVVEIIDPLNTTDVTITGTTISGGTNPGNVALRPALGALSFEGFGVLPNGVVYYGDEKRPGTGGVGGLGGSLYKFVPTTPWVVGNPPITSLAQSPLVDGRVFGFRPGRNGGSFSNTDAGPGNEFGRGWWVEIVEDQVIDGATIHRADLGAAATALHLSAYYRPEDIDVDLKALEDGNVRVCGTNTGQDIAQGDNHWGEVYCLTDGTPAQAADATPTTQTLNTLGVGPVMYTVLANSTPEYQPLVIGHFDFAMMDNIAYQPSTGNWILHEDGEGPSSPGALKRGNDLWDCLDDGADKDILSDGCVKIGTINDTIGALQGNGGGGAEWTGGIFDATGTHFFVSLQHAIGTGTSGTPGPSYAHGYILDITGWKKLPPGQDKN